MARITRRDFLIGTPGAAAVTAVTAVAVSGCQSIPIERVVYLIGKGIGLAAGVVVCECSFSSETREALAAVVEKVMTVTPGSDEARATTWIGAAKRYIESLVAAGKIKPVTAAVVLAAFAVVVYAYTLIEMRHPQVGVVRKLACAAVDGLAEGVLAVVRSSVRSATDYDVEAYKALLAYSGTVVLQMLTAAAAAAEGHVAGTAEK